MGLGDVFGLDRVYENQLQNYTNYSSETVSSFGYYFSGYIGPQYSCKVERLDYSSDTTQDVGNILDATSGDGDCIENSNYGYYSIGLGGGFRSTFRRIDFSNEVISAPSMVLHSNKGAQSGVSSPSYGYIAGGWFNPPSVTFCNIDRIDFSTETVNAQTGANQQLTITRRYLTSTQSPTSGYFCAGDSPVSGLLSTIDRLSFSTETTSLLPARLGNSTSFAGGVYSTSYGYIAGGSDPALTPTMTSAVDRLDFSTDGISRLPNSLSAGNYKPCGSQSSTYGYFAGGDESPSPRVSKIHRLDFDTSTISLSGNKTIQPAIRFAAGTQGGSKITRGTPTFENWSESATYAYVAGGNLNPSLPTNNSSSIDRFEFSTETTSTPSNKLNRVKRHLAGTESSNFGYIAGGYPSPLRREVERMEFLSETTSVPNILLYQNVYDPASFTDGKYGYFAGGSIGPINSAINKLDYETESIGKLASNLSESKRFLGAVTTGMYAYVAGGGLSPASPILDPRDTCDRFEYSTETVNINSSLTEKKWLRNGIYDTNYGYFTGGITTFPAETRTSNIEKLDFTTETFGLSTQKVYVAAISEKIGNSLNYGYFAGGFDGTQFVSTIGRLDFQTETSSVSGVLNREYSGGAAYQGGSALRQVGKNNRNDSRAGLDNQGRNVSSSYGYSIGGSPNRYEVDRFDFLNETYTQINGPSTPAPFGNSSQGGVVSNKSFGYYSAHQVPGTPPGIYARSIVARLDFTNDSWIDTSSVLSQVKHRPGCAYNHNYGYFGGGYITLGSPPDCSSIDRLDFQTESTDVLSATLSQARERLQQGLIQNNNVGYFIGGYALICTVDRLDFNTESVTVSTGMPYGANFVNGYSYDSANYGYWTGGATPIQSFSNIIRFDFANETHTDTGNNTAPNSYGANATQNDNYGYGHLGSGTSSTSRLDFSTETSSSPGTYASTSGSNGTGMSN